MTITEDRLRQTFSERLRVGASAGMGGAQEIYQEVKAASDFLGFCFEHMMDVEEFPGIQSVCIKLAFRMCKFYPELMDELKRTLEAMEIDYYKPAVKGVRNKILSGKLK